MKKNFLIKEADIVKMVQETLDARTLGKNGVEEILEEKYQEIIDEIKETVLDDGRLVSAESMDENSYNTLENIYDNKIFPLYKELHKIGQNEITLKFNELEDMVVDFLEIYREHSVIKKEMDDVLNSLEGLIRG